jgi:hypothetical protein
MGYFAFTVYIVCIRSIVCQSELLYAKLPALKKYKNHVPGFFWMKRSEKTYYWKATVFRMLCINASADFSHVNSLTL